MPYLSSKLFDYDHETNTFSAWMSELGPQPFHPVFNDAADVGVSIVSSKTAAIADFYISLTEKDVEHDIVAWHLIPTPDTIKLFPLLKDTKVVIFND